LADPLAEALGLLSATSPIEGYVGFGSDPSMFDYNRADGITPGQFDFIGTVAHEISEVLGRSIGVGQDIIGNDMVPDYFPLDLFHYSSPGTPSFTRGGYFSIDGGQTALADFNQQATGDPGDWGGSTTNDSFLAFATPGVVNEITPVDLRVMDILGYRFVADPQQSLNIISGTPSDDNLVGTPQDDLITGFAGNDTIAGNGGNDLIYGNQGNDVIDTGPGNDTVYGGQGDDNIFNSPGSGNDLIYGNFGNDTITENKGSSTIYGGQGDDQISGGNGNDLIYGNIGDDTISAGPGNDTVFGGQNNDSINGDSGNDVIYGNFGNDTLSGDAGNNTVYGGQGNDLIVENGGTADHLFGNLGADTFDFSVMPSGVTQATADHIADFSDAQGDRVAIANPPGGIHYTGAQGDSSVTSVETAITFANAHSLFGTGAGQGNVVFVAGVTDGYLLVDADNSHTFNNASSNDFAIVLDHLNSTTLFVAADVIL
jgi:Ca2+-binding RTX toxin-like protein